MFCIKALFLMLMIPAVAADSPVEASSMVQISGRTDKAVPQTYDSAKSDGGQWTPETHCPRILFNAKDCWRAANPLWCRLGLNGEKKIDEYERWACNNCLECENTDVAAASLLSTDQTEGTSMLASQTSVSRGDPPPAAAAEGADMTGLAGAQGEASASETTNAATMKDASKAAAEASKAAREKSAAATEASIAHELSSDSHKEASEQAAEASEARAHGIKAGETAAAAKETLDKMIETESAAGTAANEANKANRKAKVAFHTKEAQVKMLKSTMQDAELKNTEAQANKKAADAALAAAKREHDGTDEALAKATADAAEAKTEWEMATAASDKATEAKTTAMDEEAALGVKLGEEQSAHAYSHEEKKVAEHNRELARSTADTKKGTAKTLTEEATEAESQALAAVSTADALAAHAGELASKVGGGGAAKKE